MINYNLRSKPLLSLVNEVRANRYIPDAYFQRNLVWLEKHKIEFIETILLGYPFPQIFLSRGKVDVEKMETVSCIVDGQQRTDAIISYIEDKFRVDGRFYSELTGDEKAKFLSYEIAFIELELENDDPRVQEIFQRINRNANVLTAVEKLASEYATSEFMLTAKLLCDQIDFERDDEDDGQEFRVDPNIPEEFLEWASQQKVRNFVQLITEKKVFTARELSKKNHLQHVLNMMAAYLTGMTNRDTRSKELLNEYATGFDSKTELVNIFEETAKIILALKLRQRSYFFNKANLFSLVIAISDSLKLGVFPKPDLLKKSLDEFEKSIPENYRLAAKESVNSTANRELRGKYLSELVANSEK